MSYAVRACELKSAEGVETLDDIDVNADELAKAAELVGKLDQRIAALETKSAKIEQRLSRPAIITKSADADVNLEREAFGSFLKSRGFDTLSATDQKALTVATDAAVGYVLAPEDVTREFIRNLVEWSPVRGIADVRSTISHTVTVPKRLTVTNARWTGEAVATTASEPTFGQIAIPVRELTTHVDIGDWVLEDSAGTAESEVRLALAEDFGKKEAVAFVNGAGASALEPEGFMVNADVAATLNGHATNLSADALINLMYALPATYRNRGTWAMNPTTLATIRKLKNTAGDYLWQPALSAGQPETILGRPVVEMPDGMPDPAANAFPIMFGDFKAAYRIYDRLDLVVKPNPYLLATENKVRYHARRRTGAAVVRPDALRKLKMAVS